MQMCQDELKEVLSPTIIQERIQALGRQITLDYAGRSLVLVGVLKGAFIFLADLCRAIDLPIQVDFVRMASYGSKQESSGRISFTKDIELDIKGKDVLVVEDIIDTGHTIKYLKEVLTLHQPASVRICCLIDKHERREVAIQADYVGFEVKHGFLVGYGLDFAEDYRCLPGVFHLNPGHRPKAFQPSDR
jgi:hypoxanthine phosphoribosyltransferase